MAAQSSQAPGISRREFLYYIWTASIALYTAEFLGLIIWYAIPIIPEGEFGGPFPINSSRIPGKNEPPANFADGRFWIVNVDTNQPNNLMRAAEDELEPIVGILALYKVCTHLGCIYPWNEVAERFVCPCHGSQYRLDGRRIASPAPRTLDRFKIDITFVDGTTESSGIDSNGQYAPIEVEGREIEDIIIQTGQRVDGATLQLLNELEF
ncbi:MAG: Rieske 2Fe-2S domain-containing protein [Chloroflexota bacterium]